MEFFLPVPTQTGPEVPIKGLPGETQPVEKAAPACAMATSGQAVGGGAPQATIGIEKAVVEGGALSSLASSSSPATTSSALVGSFFSALFGDYGGTSDVVVQGDAAEGEGRKAPQKGDTTPVRENDVSAERARTGETTPTAAFGTTTSPSMLSLPALEVAENVDERGNGVQKEVSEEEKKKRELLLNFVRQMCASMVDNTEKVLLKAVDVFMEFLASVRATAISVAEWMGIVEEEKKEPEGLFEQFMLWWSPPPPKAEPPTLFAQVMDFFSSAAANV